ncbi:hypothetical protein KDH_10020 [Dictyobacter sp. S3.2.2.5]|uniref:Peptidase S9 prolyl oligopeptidase catalytic domain-containing protein n=1 Tax=Dictyobacter halimunensis TaxID=3026934 RepID=A0ABQ6FKP1_9CHLR|nr:hypothetical protein KDH_10020 [Dictyobacter sp. S3.2.2.5]
MLIAGEEDHTVPAVVVKAAHKLQHANPAVTKFRKIPGRGHSLIIDHGWPEVAKMALTFVTQHRRDTL